MTIFKAEGFDSGVTRPASGVAEISVDGGRYLVMVPNADTDLIQKKLASGAPYELDMLRDMKRYLEAGDLVLDIGANIGNHTLYLAAIVGCSVVAFEPNPALADALNKSIAANGLSTRVSLKAYGLGDLAGRGSFAREIPQNLGGQSINVGEGSLEIRTLDSFSFSQRVKVMKIDVEGMELKVLRGGTQRIMADRPIIYVEVQNELEFREIFEWLKVHNYDYWDTFNATPTHLFVPKEQVTAEQRLERLQFKMLHDSYREDRLYQMVRKQLDAYQKYRKAMEQIAQLRERLAREEAAHAATRIELEEARAGRSHRAV